MMGDSIFDLFISSATDVDVGSEQQGMDPEILPIPLQSLYEKKPPIKQKSALPGDSEYYDSELDSCD